MDQFQSVDPEARGVDKDAWKQTREDLMKTGLELVKIDKRFKTIAIAVKNGTRLTQDQRAAVKRLANEYIELGQKIAAVPEQIKLADEAFSNLMKGMIKTTPLSNFIDAQSKAVEGLETRATAHSKTADAMEAEMKLAGQLNKKQYEAINAAKNLSKAQRIRLKQQIEGNQLQRKQASRTMRNRGIEDFTQDAGWRSGDQVAQIEKNRIASKEAAEEDEKAGTTRAQVLARAQVLETKILKNRREALDLEIKAAANRTQGVTTVGQLVNLEGDRLKTAKAVLTAEENLQTAEFALRESKAEAKSEEYKQAQENVKIATKELKLAELNAGFAKMQADDKEREILARQKLLKLAQDENKLNNKIASLKLKGKLIEGMSDGSAASAGRAYANKGELLQAELEAAQLKATKEAQVYNEAYLKALRELQKTEMGATGAEGIDSRGLYTGIGVTDEMKGQARLETSSAAVDSADNAAADAQANLDIHKQLKQTAIDQVANDTKNLETKAQANYFDQAGLQFLEKKMELESQFGPMSDKELKNLETQVRKQHELNQIIELKSGIANSITGNMESAFMSIVDGSKSAKQAFADMAKAILADIAKMIIKLLIQKAIMAAMGMADGGVAGPAGPSAAYGGVFGPRQGRKFTSGGIARGGTQGYPATLHGTEAVVPLPHNRKIPVELMGGAGGQQNNVSVTVNMASGGSGQDQSQTTSDSNQASQLGDIIAKAVQAELQNQKRSGGILNPYGVA